MPDRTLDMERQRLTDTLEGLEPGSDEYSRVLEQLQRIREIQPFLFEQEKGRIEKILENSTLVSTIGTLVGLGVVVTHERVHIITTKAFGLLRFKK